MTALMRSEAKLEHASLPTAQARLLTVQEAARYMAVSVSTLYGWVWQRRIPFVKMGRALRFDLGDLDRFIETSRIRSSSAGSSAK